MDEGILSLRWNNHRSTFFHVLSTLHRKEVYSDVTIACEGKFFPVHKLVLSVCSEYFEDMFKKTNCKHPIIVLKDILSEEFETLLNYMYVGEANVAQSDLARLIKAAECLRIKGLAVPDENPESNESKRTSSSIGKEETSAPKRRKQDESINKIPSTSREGHSDGQKDGHNDRHNDRQNSTVRESNKSYQSTSRSPQRSSSISPHRKQRLQSLENRKANNQGGQVIAEVVLEDEAVVKTEPKIEEEIVMENESLSFESDKQGDIHSGGQSYNVQSINRDPHNVLQDIMTQGTAQGTSESMAHWENSGGNNMGGVGGFMLEGFSSDDSSSRASQQMDLMSLGIPANICTYCGKSTFRDHSDFRRHIRIHTGERPFNCPHCPYNATRNEHVTAHIKRRHPQEAVQVVTDQNSVNSFSIQNSSQENSSNSSELGNKNYLMNIQKSNDGFMVRNQNNSGSLSDPSVQMPKSNLQGFGNMLNSQIVTDANINFPL